MTPPALPVQHGNFAGLAFPFGSMNIRPLLEGISRDGGGLRGVLEEFKKNLGEKEGILFSRLMELTPDEPSEEAYLMAIERIYRLFTEEFEGDIHAIADAAINVEMTPNELEEELRNIILPELVKLKADIDRASELLLKKALDGRLPEEELEEMDAVDRFLFIESNILGIIIETRSLETASELSSYFLLLMLRLLKLLQNRKSLTELLEDIKIVAGKIREVHPTPSAVDDYFLDELLESNT
ncbi:hypothetical protein FH039_05795 [Thermococcus indicus]|uniref:Uncharacterized protein n=1 Tax=Thermococcus indicus TaxID=2586643 RepID=A0A4Y5SLZ1_9EURY|nr:hypothetical protein [Thermococcus indicus]QDA31209.1 hypothetical protein FH039_05795 [Thermococcus indicus]